MNYDSFQEVVWDGHINGIYIMHIYTVYAYTYINPESVTDYQVQNLTIMLSIPTICSTPAMSVNNCILIHQRLSTDNSVFIKKIANYANGFGEINDSFWMENEIVHLLTQTGSRPYMLRVEMLSTRDMRRSVEYTSFSLDNSSHLYTLHVGGYSGDAGDSLKYTGSSMNGYPNGIQFSTSDKDNDQYSDSCSQMLGNCGWWFNNCWWCCLTCDANHYKWRTNPSHDVVLQVSRMMIKSYG